MTQPPCITSSIWAQAVLSPCPVSTEPADELPELTFKDPSATAGLGDLLKRARRNVELTSRNLAVALGGRWRTSSHQLRPRPAAPRPSSVSSTASRSSSPSGVRRDAPPAVVADHLAAVEALMSRAGRARPEEVLELVVANNGSP